MHKPYTILCPITENLVNAPGHLLFGSNYFENISSTHFNKTIKVNYLVYTPSYEKGFKKILSIVHLTFRILTQHHQVLYFTTDPNDLILIAILKNIGIYNKKMYAWKYIALHGKGLKRKLLHFFYTAFDKIFMITNEHVSESISSGIIDPSRICHLNWGEDLRYIDKLKKNQKNKLPIFISTGKAYRDFETLLKAFSNIDNAILKIYTSKRWGDFVYKTILDKYQSKNIQISYVDELNQTNILEFLYTEMLSADCSIVCCKQVSFGVGFTQILDSLACSLPVIVTKNPGIPIDVENRDVGFFISPNNIEDLKSKILYLIENKQYCQRMGKNGRSLINSEFNIEKTTKKILTYIFNTKLC